MIGRALGNRACELIANAPALEDTRITTQHTVFYVPLENDRFRALIRLKVFPQGMLKNSGAVETEVNRITVGLLRS